MPEEIRKEMEVVDLHGFMALKIRRVVNGEIRGPKVRQENLLGFLGRAEGAVAEIFGELVWKYGNLGSKEKIREMYLEFCAETQKMREEFIKKYGLEN